MIQQIKTTKENALAIELTDSFTEADIQLLIQLFKAILDKGNKQINFLIKVKDMSIMKHTELKAFIEGELWGLKYFRNIARCAVVSESSFINHAVKIESKILPLANAAFVEKYFTTAQLAEALQFINEE